MRETSFVAGVHFSGPAAERPNDASRCEAAISRFSISTVVLSFFVRTKGSTITAQVRSSSYILLHLGISISETLRYREATCTLSFQAFALSSVMSIVQD